MPISSRRPEDAGAPALIGQPCAMPRPAPHALGRLAPLALDSAAREIEPTLLSVMLGGLSQRQIDALRPPPSPLRARLLGLLAPGL